MVLSDRHRCALCYSTPPATCYLPMAWRLQHCVCLMCLLQGRLFSKRLLPWQFKCMGSVWHHVALSKKHIAVPCLGAGFSTLAGHVSWQKSSAMKRSYACSSTVHRSTLQCSTLDLSSECTPEQWVFAHFHAEISIYQFGHKRRVRPDLTAGRTSSEKKEEKY